MRLAAAPVSWGVDFADAPGNPPWQQVLDEIAASGVGALELGPVGYLPEAPESLRAALSNRGLTAVGSFVFEAFHDAGSASSLARTTRRAARAVAAAGGEILVLIDRPGDVRAATAGRSAEAPRLGARPWRAMLDQFEAAAEIARSHGLRPVVHPHAGGYIEFPDEIDQVLSDTSLDLCVDTGHFAYAGVNAADAIADYGERITHVHLKDVDGDVLARMVRDRLGFWDAVAARVFCPIGSGVAGISQAIAALEQSRYAGFATIEQDRVPSASRPLEDLRRSLAVLGYGDDRPPGFGPGPACAQ